MWKMSSYLLHEKHLVAHFFENDFSLVGVENEKHFSLA